MQESLWIRNKDISSKGVFPENFTQKLWRSRPLPRGTSRFIWNKTWNYSFASPKNDINWRTYLRLTSTGCIWYVDFETWIYLFEVLLLLHVMILCWIHPQILLRNKQNRKPWSVPVAKFEHCFKKNKKNAHAEVTMRKLVSNQSPGGHQRANRDSSMQKKRRKSHLNFWYFIFRLKIVFVSISAFMCYIFFLKDTYTVHVLAMFSQVETLH